MKSLSRIFWVVALSFFLAGCSSYRMAGSSLGEVAVPHRSDTSDAAVIKKGDQVRLTLVSGVTVKGRVKSIAADKIVLEPTGRTDPSRAYDASQIQLFEYRPGGDSSARTVVALAASALVVGGVILANEAAGLRNMWN